VPYFTRESLAVDYHSAAATLGAPFDARPEKFYVHVFLRNIRNPDESKLMWWTAGARPESKVYVYYGDQDISAVRFWFCLRCSLFCL
jgi:hypothetical protein